MTKILPGKKKKKVGNGFCGKGDSPLMVVSKCSSEHAKTSLLSTCFDSLSCYSQGLCRAPQRHAEDYINLRFIIHNTKLQVWISHCDFGAALGEIMDKIWNALTSPIPFCVKIMTHRKVMHRITLITPKELSCYLGCTESRDRHLFSGDALVCLSGAAKTWCRCMKMSSVNYR